jgi:hypothetical protein
MRNPTAPRNPDQDIPSKSSENMGTREPLNPEVGSERDERDTGLPDEETYERSRNQREIDECRRYTRGI